MATTKIWPVRDNLRQVINYAKNPAKSENPAYVDENMQGFFDVMSYATNDDKTEKRFFVSGVNCILNAAQEQMLMTKQRYGKMGGVVAFHAYQSFRYDEATPEVAHEIGVKTAEKLWGDRFEVVVSTHLNTDCIHNHFVINSVSFVDGKRLNDNLASHQKFRDVSDIFCRDYKLCVIDNPSPTHTPRNIYLAEKRGESTRYNIMRWDIDEAISRSFTPRFFYKAMEEKGYIMNYNPNRKYATIQMPNTAHPTRLKTLGENYTEQVIKDRILANRTPSRPLIKPQPIKFYDFSVHSLRGLYVHYCYQLGFIQKNNSCPHYSASLRAELRKLDEYSTQAILLCKNKIDTAEQLQSFIDDTQSQIKIITADRDRIYTKINRVKGEDDLPELISQRNEYTEKIKALRKDLRNANAIMERSDSIKVTIQTVQRQEEEKQQKQNNNIVKTRSIR
jgi:hypothetical protein